MSSLMGDYRFGFNGQERTDEVYGKSILYSALHWEYDSRTGRRWNLDPAPQIRISDYATFRNNPLRNTDPFGNTAGEYTKDLESGEYKKFSTTGDDEGIDFIYSGNTNEDGSFTSSRVDVMENGSRINTIINNSDGTSRAPYKSYGFSSAQNQAAAGSMLSLSVGALTGGALSATGLSTGFIAVPELGQTLINFSYQAFSRGMVEFAAQATINGFNEVDYADVGMSMFLTPGAYAIAGGILDWRPNSQNTDILRISGINKSLGETAIDFSTRASFGQMGAQRYHAPLLKQLDAPQLNFLFSLPFTNAGKLVSKYFKDDYLPSE